MLQRYKVVASLVSFCAGFPDVVTQQLLTSLSEFISRHVPIARSLDTRAKGGNESAKTLKMRLSS